MSGTVAESPANVRARAVTATCIDRAQNTFTIASPLFASVGSILPFVAGSAAVPSNDTGSNNGQ
jgi:hypothetical protein